MKYAVIDTETSGLFDFSKPAEAEGQPRLASLAIKRRLTGPLRRQECPSSTQFTPPDGS